MSVLESGEMYLETLLILSREKNLVRAIDIAEHMGFSKPAVSRALGKLRDEQLILTDNEGFIAFTEKGRGLAEKIYKRHILLTEVLEQIGVSRETAAADACKIEHIISDETFEALKRHVGVPTKG